MNYKKRIEELADEHADAILEARDEVNQSRAVALQDQADKELVKQLLSLLEEVEREAVESGNFNGYKTAFYSKDTNLAFDVLPPVTFVHILLQRPPTKAELTKKDK